MAFAERMGQLSFIRVEGEMNDELAVIQGLIIA